MARVTEFEKLEKERHPMHDVARCTYSVFKSPEGEQLFQLDTYGSRGRQFPDKISQSIQLDEKAATRLVQLLKQTFPTLR